MSLPLAVVQPLSDNNYGVWAIRARGALVARKLQTTIAPAAADANNQAPAVDAALDEEARMLLLSLMDDTRIQQNAHHATAKELWDDLKTSYERSLPAKRSALHRELNNFKLGNMTVNCYMDTIKSLQAQLDTLGDKKTPADMVRVVVDGLRNRTEYEVAISSFEDLVAANAPPTMAQMQIKLSSAEERFNERHKGQQRREYESTKAYVAQPGQYNGGNGGQRRHAGSKRECFVCGSTEHLARNCSRRHGTSNGQPGNNGQPGRTLAFTAQLQPWSNVQQTGGDQIWKTLAF